LRAGINHRPYTKKQVEGIGCMVKGLALRHYVFSAFRIPTSEFVFFSTPVLGAVNRNRSNVIMLFIDSDVYFFTLRATQGRQGLAPPIA